MGSQEFEGKSVREAVERARIALGRDLRETDYEIVEDRKRGILGLGSRHARIRVLIAEEEAPRREPIGRSPAAPPASAGPHEQPDHAIAGERGTSSRSRHRALQEVAGRIVAGLKLDLTLRLHDRDETIILDLGGRDAHLLLDGDGEALDALQHVLNKIVSRDDRFLGRVVTDCEGFRGRRDGAIVARALKVAEEARRSGRVVTMDGLNAYERRLVHLALADAGGVRSFSTGEGARKRLTIEPT